MKKLIVEVCVCTQCVMNGAMDIIESIESLQKLKVQLRLNAQIQVEMNKCLGNCKHSDIAPVVAINGVMVEHANCETIMSKIVAITSKDVNH